MTGYRMDGRVSIPGMGKRFLKAPRAALRPTRPPIEWVPEALSPGVKREWLEADHHVHLVQRSRMAELYLFSLIHLHGTCLIN
jgi:hypothetical protein